MLYNSLNSKTIRNQVNFFKVFKLVLRVFKQEILFTLGNRIFVSMILKIKRKKNYRKNTTKKLFYK